MLRFTSFDLKFSLLELFPVTSVGGGNLNKFNILGRPYQPGSLENKLQVKFTDEERASAGKAFNELIGAGLLRPTYTDSIQPEDWVVITEAGCLAVKSRMLDDLDRKLCDSDLIEIRHGMWAAVNSGQPDSIRQAAHSGRELITKIIHKLAADEEVRAQAWFKPDLKAKSGITRKHRLKHILTKKQPGNFQEEIAIIEQICDLIDSLYNKLSGTAHAKPSDIRHDLKDLLQTVEIALGRIL